MQMTNWSTIPSYEVEMVCLCGYQTLNMVQNDVHTWEISIVVDDVGKCKEEVFYVNEETGDPKAEENLAPKARCGPRGFPVYTRIVFPGIPMHCIMHTLVYLLSLIHI